MGLHHISISATSLIECFHSRGQHLCKFIETKESVCIRKEFNSQRTGLGHQHGRRFIVLGHQYGRRDVKWKHSIVVRKRLIPECLSNPIFPHFPGPLTPLPRRPGRGRGRGRGITVFNLVKFHLHYGFMVL